MKYPIAELADKYTILMIKREHAFEVEDEMLSLSQQVPQSLNWIGMRELFKINSKMWDLEEEITANVEDLETVGRLYLELRELSLQRVDAKNKIAREHGEPEEDRKY